MRVAFEMKMSLCFFYIDSSRVYYTVEMLSADRHCNERNNQFLCRIRVLLHYIMNILHVSQTFLLNPAKYGAAQLWHSLWNVY